MGKILGFILLSITLLGQAQAQVNLKKGLQEMNLNWGTDPSNPYSVGLSEKLLKLKSKKQVTVAVVDTGIDPNHPLLKNNLVIDNKGTKASKDFFGYDFSKNAPNKKKPFDQHGHGTHIAGIVKTVYPQAKIMVLKYYNPQAADQDNLDSTIAALEYAVKSGVDIINYSSGGAGASISELRVLKKAEQKGILVVAAAGNHGSDIDKKQNHYFPASYGLSNILTVVNHDKLGKLNITSNFGVSKAHVSAPGSRIKSSLPNSRMGFLSGTSQSTAFVSGVAALVLSQFPDLTYSQLKQVILDSVKKKGQLAGKCSSQGIVNAGAAYESALKTNASSKKRGLAQNR